MVESFNVYSYLSQKVAKVIRSSMVECVGPVARMWEIWFCLRFPQILFELCHILKEFISSFTAILSCILVTRPRRVV